MVKIRSFEEIGKNGDYIEEMRNPVKSFKTRRGMCFLCMGNHDRLERHHELYEPERCIWLCHKCHFKVTFKPYRLSEQERQKLLINRHLRPLSEVAKEEGKTVDELIRDYKSPRRPRGWKKQWVVKPKV